MNRAGSDAWVVGMYMKVINDYLKSLEKYPNPPAFKMTEFRK